MGGAFAESWTTATISGAMTADAPALVVVPATGQGVGLVHVATSNLLDYTIYDGATWSSFTQLHADATLGPPAIVGSGATAQVVYGGTNYNFYIESWSGSAWSASTPAIVPSDAGSLCGPSAPSLALAGADLSMVFVNGICSGTTNALYDSDLSGGSWQAATTIATNPSNTAAQRPAVTTPSSGPELVVAFIAQGTSQIYTSYRTGSTWSTPVLLTSGLTNDPVALAPVAGGGATTAVMAYRGTDGKLYTSVLQWHLLGAADRGLLADQRHGERGPLGGEGDRRDGGGDGLRRRQRRGVAHALQRDDVEHGRAGGHGDGVRERGDRRRALKEEGGVRGERRDGDVAPPFPARRALSTTVVLISTTVVLLSSGVVLLSSGVVLPSSGRAPFPSRRSAQDPDRLTRWRRSSGKGEGVSGPDLNAPGARPRQSQAPLDRM